MRRSQANFIPLCIMLAMMLWGCAQDSVSPGASMKEPAVQQTDQSQVYAGKIIGVSKKAKTISIEVGKGDKAKTMMVRFDGETEGIEHAAKGEAAIVTWEMRGSERVATVIKPKLAKLPEGVAEITTDELSKLLRDGAELAIIDSRPAKPFDQSHLPGAISIPVDQMGISMDQLPSDKDKLLVFYCGGFT